jgi:hypothetical protein
VSGDPEESGFGESGFSKERNSCTLESRNAISRRKGCVGPQQEIVDDRWHSIGDREKESPESIDIRIRDPANSKVPIEVAGS